MSFDAYDEMVEKFDKIDLNPPYPSFEQIEMFRKEPEQWVKYCCFILEKAKKPETAEEKYSKKNLTGFVNENLELIDSVE